MRVRSRTLLLLLLPPVAVAAKDLCPRVRIDGADPKLSESEKRLVCGDEGSDGWKKVPLAQARDFMISFLQQRGRHFPAFTTDGETLVVDPGTTTVVRSLVGAGLEGLYDLGKRRKVKGSLLTPELLDTVKKALVFELGSRGYECPKVAVTADARTGEVRADASAGARSTFTVVPPPAGLTVDPGVMRRYEAFVPGRTLDARMLSLTSDRMKEDALFASAYFDVLCSTAGASVTQRVVEASSHLLTVGVGADTEGLLRARARLRQSRIGPRAHFAEASLSVSQREQAFDALMRLYASPGDRVHLAPAFFVRREDEVQYQAAHSEASLSPGWTSDAGDMRLEVRGGPAVDWYDTLRGQGPRASKWFQFVTTSKLSTHLYEYFQRDPREGWSATFETAHRVAGAYSDLTAHWMRLSGESLWNVGAFEPPLFVVATRGSAGTVSVQDRASGLARLPPTQRFFLGGDADLRGSDRKRLPDDGAGFLTTVYEGVELRLGDVLPARVEPFVFVDGAMGGQTGFHLDRDVYWSPGTGIRWASPFGTLRGTAARGLVWRRGSALEPPKPRWQFFFSFGKEF